MSLLRKPPKYVISTKVSVLCELLVHNCSKCSPTFATSLVVPDPKSKSYCSHSSVQDRRVPISRTVSCPCVDHLPYLHIPTFTILWALSAENTRKDRMTSVFEPTLSLICHQAETSTACCRGNYGTKEHFFSDIGRHGHNWTMNLFGKREILRMHRPRNTVTSFG